MQTSTEYKSYVNSMKNYETTQGRKEYQAPFAEDFEAIYTKAKEQEIGLTNAKEFLQDLSRDEIRTLQKYTGLADSVNVDSLSSEGAYNLLLHDYEKYDFNGDGVAEVGAAKSRPLVPTNMPADVRDAYINAMNSMSDRDKLLSSMLTLDPARLKAMLNDEPYTPTKIDYDFLKTAVENLLNPQSGGFTSEDTKTSIRAFWDAFNASFTGDKTPQESEKRSDAVAEFLKDLRTKGAAKYLADLNQEKIDKLVEEFEQKLLETMGDSPQSLVQIAKQVEDYKKQLTEAMQEKMENEKKNAGENSPHMSKNSAVQMLIEMQQEKREEPLKKLLTN